MQPIGTPGEVPVPILSPRVEEGSNLIGKGIGSMRTCPLVAVAQITGKPQVVNAGAATGSEGDDVLNLEAFRSKTPGSQTVATALVCILPDLLSNVFGNVRALRGQVALLTQWAVAGPVRPTEHRHGPCERGYGRILLATPEAGWRRRL